MPRYYFHIRDHNGLREDLEGAEFATVEQAHEEAVRSARELLGQRVARGDIVDGDAFELTSDDGTILATVKFRDLLRLE
ncbi:MULTISPECIES: DUF6894 family protein [Rhizobium]|uniref:DUF6894 domain-containing protein n=1 Tax=Rhizobium wenxiniae TaxID=1737357 RepID=A0A7W9YBC4_9HYPH|nr:hypothetical protein [Rhizobium wenxiniae]MBB6164643.1 hypothetical protein [Rhizobium wenxiniae]GGG06845.1 hypothetical protein GCM10010924_39470 [Rhizobium wenxiniae]